MDLVKCGHFYTIGVVLSLSKKQKKKRKKNERKKGFNYFFVQVMHSVCNGVSPLAISLNITKIERHFIKPNNISISKE